MTLFEYIIVVFSIVLSLAIVRLLGGLAAAFDPTRRYWPHAALIVFTVLSATMSWWNFWSFRHVQWNIGSFFLTLTVPASIYLQAVALVPDDVAAVRSWRTHCEASRRAYYIALASFLVFSIVVSRILLDLSLMHPIRLGQGAALLLGVVGVVSKSNRIHEYLPWLFIALLVFVAGAFFVQPEAMLPDPGSQAGR